MVGKPMFVKEVVYEDLKAFCSMWQRTTTDTEIQKVNAEFFSYVVNLESRLVMEIV
jgi:hypothetical protein